MMIAASTKDAISYQLTITNTCLTPSSIIRSLMIIVLISMSDLCRGTVKEATISDQITAQLANIQFLNISTEAKRAEALSNRSIAAYQTTP